MSIMCPDYDRYIEYWRTPLSEWLHYHIFAPGSFICVIVAVICFIILNYY